jgi:ABC-type enterochelin transport system substrate-binding protein
MKIQIHVIALVLSIPFISQLTGCTTQTKKDGPAQARIALMNYPNVFGEKEKGTSDNPAVVEEPDFSMIRGTRASLIIASGAAEEHKPVLYVEPKRNSGVKKDELQAELNAALKELGSKWPGIRAEPFETGFRVEFPSK